MKDIIEVIKYKLTTPKIMSNYVKVEVSANCNARCSWCWMFKSESKPHGLIDVDNFKKFVDLNKNYFHAHNAGIMPFFNGECLIHPGMFDILDYMKDNSIKLMDLDTNFGVNIDIAKLLSYPFKHIRVNIGGLTKEVHEDAMKTDFDLVTSNMKKAFEIDSDRIYVKMVVTKNNIKQLPAFGDFIKELGGSPEHKIVGELGFPLPASAKDEDITEFFNDIVSDEITDYLKFDYDKGKERYGIKARKKGCQFLLNCVTFDGKLTICCQDQLGKLNLGNAFETPIIDLVARPEYKTAIEKAQNMSYDFCPECN